jgi:hypothetical protein
MKEHSVWKLHSFLEPHMARIDQKRKQGAVPNGDITLRARVLQLSMELRCFAGGDP